jgi:DNA-directed RNA polymerase specialized sigma24 family protein
MTRAGARCGVWLFTMAKSAAIDIARRPSSRPFLPVEDFQLPPQYDTADQALTVVTVDLAVDELPSIYGDVMRLARDGFTARPGRRPWRRRSSLQGRLAARRGAAGA